MKLREVIVVEGKNDTKKLKTFFDVDTIETNGMYLSKEKLDIIKQVNSKRGVILFLDPDTPGEKIRKRINDYIPDLKNAFIDKHVARTTKKVGIEHASKEDLENSLKHLITYSDTNNTLSYEDYLDLGFNGRSNSKELREYVGKLLFLGKCNAKTLYKRLNMYQIDRKELERIVEGFYE